MTSFLPLGESIREAALIWNGPESVFFIVSMNHQGTSGGEYFAGVMNGANIIIPEGCNVYAYENRGDPTGQASVFATISGYLESA